MVTVFEYTADETIITQEKSIIPVDIEKTDLYWLFFTLDNPSGGMMMNIRVLNIQGDEIFQCIGESFNFSQSLTLEKGVNTVEIIYLRSQPEFLDYVTSRYTFNTAWVDEKCLLFDIVDIDVFEINYSVIYKK